MKNILKIALSLLILLPAVSCEKQNTGSEEIVYLDVNANNISGDWKLDSWEGGQMADADVAVYLRFIRKNTRYEMYSNIGSMEFVRRTGDFVITADDNLGAVLSGSYDYTLGETWNHDYVVTLIERNGAAEMTLTAVDDAGNVCTYVRCSIPEEITGAFPPVGE